MFRILSIDGGGIRGLIPAQVLVKLEEILQRRFGENTAISDCFDLVAGTSTGGILSCILLAPNTEPPTEGTADDAARRPRFTAIDAAQLYRDRGAEIFSRTLWERIKSANGILDEKYPADDLERILQDYFGDLELKNLLRPCLITAYDIERRKAHFFGQHKARQHSDRNFHVRDVARATSAAPTYFEAARVKSLLDVPFALIDGGVFANNPSMCALAEARGQFSASLDETVVLSLGTGTTRQPYAWNEAKDWGLAGWIGPLIDILFSGVSDTVDFQLQQLFEGIGQRERYLRIDREIGRLPMPQPEMDNVDEENIEALRAFGIELAEDFSDQLEGFSEVLAPRAPQPSVADSE